MYVCATGSIPIALSLMLKGLSPGTALVLLMAGQAANFASFTLISREMGKKAAAIYLASIIIGSMAFGLAIDYLLPSEWFNVHTLHAGGHGHGFEIFPTVCSVILVVLLVVTFIKGHKHQHIDAAAPTKVYVVTGMACSHCRAAVQESIAAVEGVKQVDVDLSSGRATVEGTPDDAAVIAAVRNAGFDVQE